MKWADMQRMLQDNRRNGVSLISLEVVRMAVHQTPGFRNFALSSHAAPALRHDGTYIHGACWIVMREN